MLDSESGNLRHSITMGDRASRGGELSAPPEEPPERKIRTTSERSTTLWSSSSRRAGRSHGGRDAHRHAINRQDFGTPPEETRSRHADFMPAEDRRASETFRRLLPRVLRGARRSLDIHRAPVGGHGHRSIAGGYKPTRRGLATARATAAINAMEVS